MPRCAVVLLSAFLLLIARSPSVHAAGAEIVLLQGGGEKTSAPGPQPAGWEAASQGDVVEGGYWVRTLANSQMGLTVPSRNQIRLNQNSVLQVKTEEESQAFQQARVKLAKGRAWSQARPRPAQGTAVKEGPSLAMETPAATLSIRGTDWEVEVGEDGALQVVVLSGRVEVGNAQGEVSVGAGEAARARIGEAPQKLVLVDPESRVQWVSSWVPRPGRWIGEEAAQYAGAIARIEGGDYEGALPGLLAEAGARTGAAVLAADLLVYRGELERAAGLLEPKAGDPRALALLARVLLRLDRGEEARTRLDQGLSAHPQAGELWLARGEVAVLEGDAAGARSAFSRALEGGTGAEGWYGLGRVSSEREYVREARRELEEALRRDPGLEAAAAERAAVETFAGNLGEAERRYAEVLSKSPSNYVALTGLGINRLKEGEAEGALEEFLKAGLVEPRYARGWMYQGVAFYRLGERYRAEQAFGKAGELDGKDPVVHMMSSQVAADELAYGEAIGEAREAQAKMPYLKSLNQLANDQRGSANLGSPLADFGLEAWAKYYADEAYSPYWGGSHLFLSDRYTGTFNKTSELMKGFITDPLAFGASNRFASLAQTPGHYARIDSWYLGEVGFQELGLGATANGLAQTERAGDMSYFLRGEYRPADSRWSGTTGETGELVAGLGWKPRHDIGVFAYALDKQVDADIEDSPSPPDGETAFTEQDQSRDERRVDLGMHLRLDPANVFWLKGGIGENEIGQDGALWSGSAAAAIEQAIPSFILRGVSPRGELERFDGRVEASDLQFRHAFDAGGGQWSWGVEFARQEQTLDSAIVFPARLSPGFEPPSAGILQDEALRIDDEQAWFSLQAPLNEVLRLQFDVFAQDVRVGARERQSLALLGGDFGIGAPVDKEEHAANFNPRMGLRWDLGDTQQLRLVAQRWRRPSSFGSLAPVDTLGVPLNDSLPAFGGKYERVRLQYDGEFEGRWFLRAFLDREVVDNGLAGERSPSFSNMVDSLTALRARQQFFTAEPQIEQTPIFPDGSVSSAGLDLNLLLSPQQTLSARYVYRYGDNNSDNPAFDGEIPYIPHHYAEFGSQWTLPGRWLLRADAIYHSRRFQNDPGQAPAEAGWYFRLKTYWETPDKHHSVQLVLDNLFLDADTMIFEKRDQYLNLQYSYRL